MANEAFGYQKFLAALTMAALGIAGSASQAQQAVPVGSEGGATALEEVIVTAQRRAERLTDVPMSVQVLSQVDMDQQGVRTIDDLTRISPGVTFLRTGLTSASNYNDENSDISIRGVDSNFGAATTGIYIDDTPLVFRHGPIGATAFPALFDLERVEVLEGPQGTLFGAGAMGGVVRFLTPETSVTSYSGYTRAEFGQLDGSGRNYEAGAAFGGPIINGVLGFRVSAYFREDGGWVDRAIYARPPSYIGPNGETVYTAVPTITSITETNANWRDTQSFRAALKWTPLDNLSVDPSFFVQTLHLNDTGAYWVNLSDPPANVYNNGNLQRNPSTDPWSVSALKVTWNVGWGTLVSDTSYFRRNQHSISDYSQFISLAFLANQYPINKSTADFADHQTNFMQELRLSSNNTRAPLQWTVGLFYAHAYENQPVNIYSVDLAPVAPNNIGFQAGPSETLDKQRAVFGELTYKFFPTLSLTAGARYSKLDYSSHVVVTTAGLFNGSPTAPATTATTDLSNSSTPFTPRFVLKYQPLPDSLYYASASKGFRAGSANAPFPPAVVSLCDNIQAPPHVDPDSIWQYELGTKQRLLDGRLQISASIYYYLWKDIQQTVYLQCGYSYGANLGEAVGKGGSLTAAWRVTDGLTLSVNGAYTDAVYQNIESPSVKTGNHLPASPWDVNASAEYDWAFSKNVPYARIDYQFASAQNSLTQGNDPANVPYSDPTIPGLPEIRILSGRVGLRHGGLDASLFVQNALNFHTPILVSRDVYTYYATNYFARGYPPRTLGLTAIYRF